MNQIHKNELYEKISHSTASAPYSLHHTIVPSNVEPALYLHWHNEMEFFLLIEGELLFRIENQTYILHAGDGIFVPPRLLHQANRNIMAPVTYRAFVLSPDIIFSYYDTLAFQKYILPIMHNNLSYATVLSKSVDWQNDILSNLQLIFSAENTNELYIRGITFLIWNKFYHNYIATLEGRKVQFALVEQLSGALAYLHDNYNKNITLSELSSLVPLSEAQFCRSFKLLTGMPPFKYLIRYRIFQSCFDLCNSSKKITDIAISNGFSNISYYNRAFYQLMKMTPSEYRKKHIVKCD